MDAALAMKPLQQLLAQYGQMRMVLHPDPEQCSIPREKRQAYRHYLMHADQLRESRIDANNGSTRLSIRFLTYTDPVSLTYRYAVDYWSLRTRVVIDHTLRAVAEKAYEETVRAEFAHPALPMSVKRFTRGLASFYDVTDVI
ncbi:hypothetical protein [Streptomyces glaucus]|uniref:Uncharacterized protein n=1 Tax=Streptomyces glaucus TaxID=284029 RepID=A0ABP5X0P5_9ACTN